MNGAWITATAGVDVEIVEESALAMAQATIQSAMKEAQLNRAELAGRMDRPRSFVTKILRGSHNLTVKTLARALFACGYEIRFERNPLIWSWREEPLVAVPASAGTFMLAS